MTRPRAADDFAVIRARMEELRRESMPEPADDDSAKPRPRSAGNKPVPPPWLQEVLIAWLGFEQAPVPGLQVPARWH